jgi:putative transposase
MEKKLYHSRHIVSMLTDHLVFSPKYRGKVLVGDVRDYTEKIIREICKEKGIEIIKMAVNSEHIYFLSIRQSIL